MFIGEYSLSVFFSYIAVGTSLFSCYYAINGNLKISLLLFMCSGLIDMLDGRFANLFKRNKFQKRFGEQIDTVLDVFNFGAIPIFLVYLYGYNDLITILFLVFYLFAATMRLAYFNTVIEVNSKKRLYQGLPVTTITLTLPIIILLTHLLNNSFGLWTIRILLFIVSILYISNIKFTKPKSIFFIISMIFAGLAVLLSLFLFLI
ncbi:MAG TPA: hypothetical protein PLT65_05755 [Bacilli bacterium]|nr:hypothetical protein [Bacilli bacterium]